jgi:TPR repeat protein
MTSEAVWHVIYNHWSCQPESWQSELSSGAQAPVGEADGENVSEPMLLAASLWMGLFHEKNTSQAMELMLEGEQKGDVRALELLGVCHLWGTEGFKPQPDQAHRWFQKAAAFGSPVGLNGQGYCAEHFQGDLGAALDFYFRAAALGNPGALYNLGLVYLKNREYVKAVEFFQRGTDLGHVPCTNLLAKCFANGWGVAEDVDQALKLFRKAAEAGYLPSWYHMYVWYQKADNFLAAIDSLVQGSLKGDESCAEHLTRVDQRDLLLLDFSLRLKQQELQMQELASQNQELAAQVKLLVQGATPNLVLPTQDTDFD